MSGRMNASERQALRQVVRQRMKVLRADVAARKAELEAEVEGQVAARFARTDKIIADLNEVIAGVIDQATKDIDALTMKTHTEHGIQLYASRAKLSYEVTADPGEKHAYRRQLHADIEAKCRLALVEIDRREADLISDLTVDGLETQAAKDFLGRIPTVGELVPAARMKEITG